MLHFSNGETAEYIDVMYCDSVVARIDYNKVSLVELII